MGHRIVIVGAVHVTGQQDLLDVVNVNRVLSLVLGLRERGQEHACEDCDNGYDDEQFDERKCPLPSGAVLRRDRCWLLHNSIWLSLEFRSECWVHAQVSSSIISSQLCVSEHRISPDPRLSQRQIGASTAGTGVRRVAAYGERALPRLA